MKDLQIHYLEKSGQIAYDSFKTIMDFTDFIERHPTCPLMNGHHITAVFFENSRHTKSFYTMKELYDFCTAILK